MLHSPSYHVKNCVSRAVDVPISCWARLSGATTRRVALSHDIGGELCGAANHARVEHVAAS